MMTQPQIKQAFNNYISQQNPDINPNIIGTDWDIYGTALAGVAAGFYQDVESLRQAIFTQYSAGLFLDYKAFSLGLAPRQGASFSLSQAENSVLPMSIHFFPAGTIFTSTFNSSQYLLINDTTMFLDEPTVFSLQSVQSGTGYQLPAASTLTNTLFPDVTIAVSTSTDGQLAEGDGQFRKRILNAQQNPTGSGRASDYINWAIESGAANNAIQSALVIPNFFPNSSTIGVFTLSGTFNYDNVVLNPEPYTLTTPAAYLVNARNYINTKRPVQANVYVQTVATYMIPNDITINVILPEGVTLATTVNNFNDTPVTVENIIFQEFRRGIVSYTLGGSILDGVAYLHRSQIEQSLDVGLSINGGIYAQLLISREIEVDGIPKDIVVPYNTLDGDDRLECVYDIDQSQVTIVQVP